MATDSPFSLSTLKCQCVLTNSLPIIETCLERLQNANPPLTDKQQLHQLQIAVHHLKQAEAQHIQFQAEYARAFWEQHKRSVVGLQTSSVKQGRELQKEVDEEAARRQRAIEAGRIKKRTSDTPARQNKTNKKRAL